MKAYTVRRVRVNAQGYELPGGWRYWGAGAPLYRAISRATGDELAEVRAGSRKNALELFSKEYNQSFSRLWYALEREMREAEAAR